MFNCLVNINDIYKAFLLLLLLFMLLRLVKDIMLSFHAQQRTLSSEKLEWNELKSGAFYFHLGTQTRRNHCYLLLNLENHA